MITQIDYKFIKKRTLQEFFFRKFCAILVIFYLLLLSFFILIIIKSGIDSFLTTKIRIEKLDDVQKFSSIISHSQTNKEILDQIEETGESDWMETKGAFSYYYKQGFNYNRHWNTLIEELKEKKEIAIRASLILIKNTDSPTQEEAGLLGAIKGTLMVILIFITFAGITGIATGMYIAEFADNKFLTNLVSLNISNLASVPPIIYGIFGLQFLVNGMGIPRSSALLGGLILGLLTLPIIVIVTIDSFKSVPSHLKFSAKALGLTHMQTIFRVCLPFAFPRILTGILLSLSRGISEATPLILIGMASFIKTPPHKFTEPATTLATQIYLWITSPDGSFIEKAYGSIFVLLCVVASINLFASLIRYKVTKRTQVR